ncbi:VOC family protein [Solimonas sp. K1W22B-7]|uniref:VOC family protein n=1 Tax=Solimonas sp. K1W22B-7 TaxID=2303331 RepID=UPI000E3340FC|nr:VOC family protein [Solimonas sp. K1W22B-7]AXQ29182.1 VOC family protein [Solimonas sp. K1W22B-7]
MIDHVGIEVSDYWEAKNFYTAVLGALGYEVVIEYEGHVGFGQGGKPDFWIHQGKPTVGVHLAFRARSHKEVDRFYQIALQGGARDNGPPGLRTHYHPYYYGAFVLDADGRNIEAVCHEKT